MDKNQDGVLTFDEMESIIEIEDADRKLIDDVRTHVVVFVFQV